MRSVGAIAGGDDLQRGERVAVGDRRWGAVAETLGDGAVKVDEALAVFGGRLRVLPDVGLI